MNLRIRESRSKLFKIQKGLKCCAQMGRLAPAIIETLIDLLFFSIELCFVQLVCIDFE